MWKTNTTLGWLKEWFSSAILTKQPFCHSLDFRSGTYAPTEMRFHLASSPVISVQNQSITAVKLHFPTVIRQYSIPAPFLSQPQEIILNQCHLLWTYYGDFKVEFNDQSLPKLSWNSPWGKCGTWRRTRRRVGTLRKLRAGYKGGFHACAHMLFPGVPPRVELSWSSFHRWAKWGLGRRGTGQHSWGKQGAGPA